MKKIEKRILMTKIPRGKEIRSGRKLFTLGLNDVFQSLNDVHAVNKKVGLIWLISARNTNAM